ncbi:MAG: MscL family protein [Candidatus Thermoplasmatota archaeon]|nr:MscL family protein [Candidatus Thermoplasmatota archaeon]
MIKVSVMDNDQAILEELKKIREILTPRVSPLPQKGFIPEFRDFLSKYKVMGLAVAFILGIYLGALVQSLVNDLIMPIVQFATPGVLWQNIVVGPFLVGRFAGSLLTFIIIAFVIFGLVKITGRLKIE